MSFLHQVNQFYLQILPENQIFGYFVRLLQVSQCSVPLTLNGIQFMTAWCFTAQSLSLSITLPLFELT